MNTIIYDTMKKFFFLLASLFIAWSAMAVTVTVEYDPTQVRSVVGLDPGVNYHVGAAGETVNLIAIVNPAYRMIGWYKGAEQVSDDSQYTFTMPETDLTLKVEVDETIILVSIESDGNGTADIIVGKKASYVWHDEITVAAEPFEFYEFVNWTNESVLGDVYDVYPGQTTTFTLEKSLNLTAHFKGVDCMITGVAEYGTIAGTGMQEYGTYVDLTVTPNPGYQFIGWSDGDTQNPRPVYVTGDATYTALFEAETYTVTFEAEGEILQTQTLAVGSPITTPANPSKTGFTFTGWYPTVPATVPAHDVTFTATFAPVLYNLAYFVDSLPYDAVQTYNYNELITPLDAPVKSGFTFIKWDHMPVDLHMPAENLEVYAVYEPKPYTLTYIVDGDTLQPIDTLSVGDPIVLRTMPDRIGYQFSGWTFKDLADAPTVMPASDLVAEGTYNPRMYRVYYMADTIIDIQYYHFNQAITVTDKIPTKTGYTFSHWVGVPDSMFIPEDLYVNAYFTINHHTIYYILDGDIVWHRDYEYGAAIEHYTPQAKEGYTFSGWNEEPLTMLDDDVYAYGTYTIDNLTVTYTIDGVYYNETKYAYDALITPLTAPARTGCEFVAWQGLPERMPATDITVEAIYDSLYYTLTYQADGETIATQHYTYGATVEMITPLPKKGYTFNSWDKNIVTMPAENQIVNALYTINQYRLFYTFEGENGIQHIDTLDYNEPVVAWTAPARSGYTFAGWEGIPTNMPDSNVTVIGHYQPLTYTLTVREPNVVIAGIVISYNTLETIEYAYGDSIAEPVITVQEGYHLAYWDGWQETMPNHDLTITAVYEKNTYTLTYVVDDTLIISSNTYEYDALLPILTAPTVPDKEGYTSTGWIESVPTRMPANDLTIHAYYTILSYHLRYEVDGTTVWADDVPYHTVIASREKPIKEGYTFNGWNNEPELMPASDVNVTGNFIINSYTLTYHVDGFEDVTQTYEFGADVTPITSPVKEGYIFSGWQNVPLTMPAQDITIIGYFTIGNYSLTYIVDDTLVYGQQNYDYQAVVTTLLEPTKAGYTFSGWHPMIGTMPAHNDTLYGTFLGDDLTITYRVDGNIYRIESQTVATPITLLPEPTKEGYTFSGWSAVPAVMPTHNIEVSGSFIVNSYKLTYIVGSDTIGEQIWPYGATVEPLAKPEKEGYTFSGWAGYPLVMPAHNDTVYGSFNQESYTLIYRAGDGIADIVEIHTFGETLTAPAGPAKNGYTFSHWIDAPTTMPAQTTIVNALYTANPYNLIYLVDGLPHDIIQYTYGETINYLPEPTKEGHTFYGWNNKYGDTMPAQDWTVTGYFEVNEYTVTYIVDGELYNNNQKVLYGNPIVTIAEPTRIGQTFSGWQNVPATMPEGGAIITGYFTTEEYTVTYTIPSEAFSDIRKYPFGAVVENIAAPEKIGYTFTGWEGKPTTMPANNITLYGSYDANSYTLTFTVDGVANTIKTYEYGAPIPTAEIPTPVKAGYQLNGWNPAVPTTMPAENTTVAAMFSPLQFTLTYIIDGVVAKTQTYACDAVIQQDYTAPEKEGYTFQGWTGMLPTMPDHDLTVTAFYKKNTYTLTYKVDGQPYGQLQTYAYNDPITEPAPVPTKQNYTFSGWDKPTPTVMPAENVEINAYFTPSEFTLTYIFEGEIIYTENIPYGTTIEPYSLPTAPEGYKTEGWFGIPTVMPNRDVTVTGNYAPQIYTVTYYMPDGTVYWTQDVAFGEVIPIIVEPTLYGHTFINWGCSLTTMPANNMNVTASFMPNMYTVQFLVDGNVYASEILPYGSIINLPNVEPTKAGYQFSGWGYVPPTMPASDLTITAVFEQATFTLTLLTENETMGTVTGGGQYAVGATATATATPATGYKFTGWSDGNTQNPRTVTMNEDITLTAQFEAKQCIVTIIAENGTVIGGTGTYPYGTSIDLLAIPDANYEFVGWSDGEMDALHTTITLTENITLEAYFETVNWEGATVTTTDFTADFTWALITKAQSYVLTIKLNDDVIQTLTMNRYGVIVSSTTRQEAPARARKEINITLFSLNSCTTYNYTLEAKDADGNNIFVDENTFTTQCRPTDDMEEITTPTITILGGTISADCEFKIYSATGQDVTPLNGNLIRGVYIVCTQNGYNQKVRIQ